MVFAPPPHPGLGALEKSGIVRLAGASWVAYGIAATLHHETIYNLARLKLTWIVRIIEPSKVMSARPLGGGVKRRGEFCEEKDGVVVRGYAIIRHRVIAEGKGFARHNDSSVGWCSDYTSICGDKDCKEGQEDGSKG